MYFAKNIMYICVSKTAKRMKDFAAIDFETANGKRTSVCSVGVVIVRNGKIVKKIYRLIRPCPNYYTQWTTICSRTDLRGYGRSGRFS